MPDTDGDSDSFLLDRDALVVAGEDTPGSVGDDSFDSRGMTEDGSDAAPVVPYDTESMDDVWERAALEQVASRREENGNRLSPVAAPAVGYSVPRMPRRPTGEDPRRSKTDTSP